MFEAFELQRPGSGLHHKKLLFSRKPLMPYTLLATEPRLLGMTKSRLSDFEIFSTNISPLPFSKPILIASWSTSCGIVAAVFVLSDRNHATASLGTFSPSFSNRKYLWLPFKQSIDFDVTAMSTIFSRQSWRKFNSYLQTFQGSTPWKFDTNFRMPPSTCHRLPFDSPIRPS